MVKGKIVTVAQLVRASGLHGRAGEKLAKEALAQISKAVSLNGESRRALTSPGIGRVVSRKAKYARRVGTQKRSKDGMVSISLRGKSRKVGVVRQQFLLVNTQNSSIRQVKSPASKSRIGTRFIRDAVVTASIGE